MPPPIIIQSQTSRRRQIIRACKARRGWTLQPAALEGIEAFLVQGNINNGNNNNASDILDMVFHRLDPHMQGAGKKTITADIVEASLGYNEYEDVDDVDDDDCNLVRRQPQHQHHQRRGGGPSRQPLSSVQQRRRRGGGGGVGGGVVSKNSSSASSKSNNRNEKNAGGDDCPFTVVSAFECPKLVYHQLKKNFQVQENNNINNKWSLFGTAEDKVDMLAQRYALVHQRILRHDLFRPSDLGRQLQRGGNTGGSNNQHHKLTPIESLLGRRSAASSTTSNSSSAAPLLLLGMLVQLEEGHYYLEDPTGQVPVSFAHLSETQQDDNFFVTEQAILLVEGTARDGIFYIHRLGHPLLEQRQTSLRAIQQQVHHPAYYLPMIPAGATTNGSKQNFVVLSDVYMDQPRVLSRLEGLFASYENFSPHRLPLFCLMGNFSSPGSSLHQQQGGSTLEGCMEELASLVTKFPNLASHAHFVIIPGPRDYKGAAGALLPMPRPRPSSMSPITKAVQHVHVGTNPCRIRWEGREMVLFRYDLLQLLQHEQLGLASSSASATDHQDGDDDFDATAHTLPHCRLIKTILEQGHLAPVAGVPIYWQYDHALRLYPLPDVLVLGLDASPGEERGAAISSSKNGSGSVSSSSASFDEMYGDCHVLHPGSISAPSNASYATVEMTRSGSTSQNKSSKGRKPKNDTTSDDSNSDSSSSSSDDDDDDGVDTRIMHIGGLSQEE